jgi:hypothetical protein
VIRYTENNPVKAGLVRDPKAWLWSSARWRDVYERLPWEKAEPIFGNNSRSHYAIFANQRQGKPDLSNGLI